MDNRPVNLFVKNVDGNAKVFSTKDNGAGKFSSRRKNCTLDKIKKETSDEIQEYAATTMSELLGWYGYDKVDSTCTRTLNLDHFTSTQIGPPTSVNSSNSFFGVSSIPLSYSTNSLMSISRQLLSPSLSLQKVSLDSIPKFSHKNCSDISCSWCGRVTHIFESKRPNSFPCHTINSVGHFCSEAAFEQMKTCDWCRHMRSPISYVDFQDGESQLQFCSDKCLNQYKMNIFCHETQTHLMLQGLNNSSFHDSEKSGLITPELWFRSCQSPLNDSTEENMTSNLLPCFYDNRTEIERKNIEKLSESNRRVCKKKISVKAKKYEKMNNCNKRKGNFCEINEHIKEPLINEKNKFHDSINSEIYHRVSCVEKNDFKKECDMVDIDHKQNDSIYRNFQNLQDKEQTNFSENMLHHDIPVLSKSSETKCEKESNFTSKSSSSKEFNQSSSLNLLPPVTVLVPYPIPIPIAIPIPILVPISSAIFSKLMTDKQEVHTKDSNCKNVEHKDNSENKFFVSHRNINNANIESLQKKHNEEPLRKRKRSNNFVNCKNEKI